LLYIGLPASSIHPLFAGGLVLRPEDLPQQSPVVMGDAPELFEVRHDFRPNPQLFKCNVAHGYTLANSPI
jgi:hypothetical protein